MLHCVQYCVAMSGSSSRQSWHRGGGSGGASLGGPESFSTLLLGDFSVCDLVLSLMVLILARMSESSFVSSWLGPALGSTVMELHVGHG